MLYLHLFPFALVADVQFGQTFIHGFLHFFLFDFQYQLSFLSFMMKVFSDFFNDIFQFLSFHFQSLILFLNCLQLFVHLGETLLLQTECCLFLIDHFCEISYLIVHRISWICTFLEFCLQFVNFESEILIPLSLFFELIGHFLHFIFHLLQSLLFLEQHLQIGQIAALNLIPHANLQILKRNFDSFHQRVLSIVVEIGEDVREGYLDIRSVLITAYH